MNTTKQFIKHFSTGYRGSGNQNPYRLRRLKYNYFPEYKSGAYIFVGECEESKKWIKTFHNIHNIEILKVSYPYEPHGIIYYGKHHKKYENPEEALKALQKLR